MDERFERFVKMAAEEFGYTVVHSDKQETFEDIFGNKLFDDIFGIELTENCDKSDETLQVIKCGAYLPMDDYAKKKSLD